MAAESIKARHGVGNILTGSLGVRAVDRFKQGSMYADRSEGSSPIEPARRLPFIGEDIAEHIGREHDIELPRVLDQLHGSIVHEHVVQFHSGIILYHLFDRLPPKAEVSITLVPLSTRLPFPGAAELVRRLVWQCAGFPPRGKCRYRKPTCHRRRSLFHRSKCRRSVPGI